MRIIRRNILLFIFALFGMLGGFLYWKFIGCQSGTCPIKSVWYMSTLYGTLIGGLTGSIIQDIIIKFRKKSDPPQNN
ncbi:MAG TPA: DUF6132 family protein [Bacteroidales bacterium]|nr:DUF6132 family protein [Bacteroidales bacterium]